MKRVWKPLDLGDGLRLYQVHLHFMKNPKWNKTHIVAASRPMEAEKIIREMYKPAFEKGAWVEEPIISNGFPLNVYQPKDWWENGVPGTRYSETEV
jgi:hypothetical protein